MDLGVLVTPTVNLDRELGRIRQMQGRGSAPEVLATEMEQLFKEIDRAPEVLAFGRAVSIDEAKKKLNRWGGKRCLDRLQPAALSAPPARPRLMANTKAQRGFKTCSALPPDT